MTSTTQDLPIFPQIAFEVLNLFFDAEPNARMIARSLSRDPGLVAHLLSLANSSLFGSNRETSDLFEALGRVGLDGVRQLLIESAVEQAFPFADVKGLDGIALWRHSSLTGQIAFRLGKLAGLPSTSPLHVAGLLHDVGLFRLGLSNPKGATALAAKMAGGLPITLAEQELDLPPHGKVGFDLVKAWHLPDDVAQMILYHETSSRHARPSDLDAGMHRQIDLLHLADVLAARFAPPSENVGPLKIDPRQIEALGLEASAVLTAVRAAAQYVDHTDETWS